MTIWLAAGASDWRGLGVPCYFNATADSLPLHSSNEEWRGSPAPVYTIPAGTKVVEVTATPKSNTYWEKPVSFSVSSDGSIAPKPESSAFVKLTSAIDPLGDKLTYANIQVSRFKDATAEVLGFLINAPATRNEPAVVQDHQTLYGTWPPKDWDLPPVPNAHFLDDVKNPVKSGVLSFATDPSLSLKKLDVDSVVLRLAGVDAPQLFAVTWPNAIAPKEGPHPRPFLVFLRQTNSNYFQTRFFKGPDRVVNFDYADIGLFETLHCAGNADRMSSAKGADPLLWPYSKGVPYQVAKAKVDVVTVCPCPTYYGKQYSKEFGLLSQTEKMGTILEDLQAFMFTKAGQVPPLSIGNTAIAAFSSTNFVLRDWLNDSTNRNGNFLSNTVRALYFLDPPPSTEESDLIADCITLALLWAGSDDRDKRIRLYNRIPWPSHKKLLGSAPPPEPFVRNSNHDRRTLSVVGDGSWKRSVAKALGSTPSYYWDWGEDHHLIAATMLTHALSWGDI